MSVRRACSARFSSTLSRAAGPSITTRCARRIPLSRRCGSGWAITTIQTARRRLHPTPEERAPHQNHVRDIIPLAQQLAYLRAAGLQGIDVYLKQLEWVIYGGGP